VNVSIITPVLLEGDAVSNDVRGMCRVLMQAGHDVHLFAEECHTSLPCGPVAKAGDRLGPDDLCIYHHSMGCTPALNLLKELSCRRLVRYHNVTPAHYYVDDLKIKLECNKGLRQLRELVNMGCEFLATSEYTARDLTALRSEVSYQVVPPYNQIDDLLRATPDYLATLPYNDAKYNVLTVGRLVPNKNLVKAVKAFATFWSGVKGRARFLIVGDPGDGRYAKELSKTADRLGIGDDVVLPGKVGLRQLRAFYLVADALLLVSEHEGFGVPLVEAMALRVPAVASSTCALPGTGGDAALYVNPSDEAAIAAALQKVTGDQGLRETMMARGRKRFETCFANNKIDRAVLNAVVGDRPGARASCLEDSRLSPSLESTL
jgi:glycosyltransferase involved in cell wall biosynthesis